jgi:hypothetical protein
MGTDTMSGGIVNNFLLKISVDLFGFVKMSVELYTRHNPFPHFLPRIVPTYLHHLFPCCYDQPKKSPFLIVRRPLFYLYTFSS